LWEKEKPKKIVIVGSGLAGLHVAAGVSKFGVKPIIFEQNRIFGGRTASYNVGGFWFDQCSHMSFKLGPPLPPSTVQTYIHDAVGTVHIPQVECKGTSAMGFYYKGKYYPAEKVFPIGAGYDRNFTKKVFSYLTDEDLNKIEYICREAVADCNKALTADVLTEYGFADFRKVPPGRVRNWLSKYTDKESIHKYWSEMVKMYTGIEVDENMEQGVYGTTFVTIMLLTGLIQFSYPYHPQYGGDAAWVNPLVDVILARGEEIRTCTPVKRVVIENGKVKGVIVVEDGEEKFVESDIVVVDVRPRIALKEGLVTENELKAWDPATLESIKDIEKEQWWEGAVVTWNVALSRKVTDEEAEVSFMDNNGHIVGLYVTKPTSAPPGMQHIIFHSYLSKKKLYPNGKLDYSVAREAVDTLRRHAIESWGKIFEESILFSEVHTMNETYGIYAAWDPEAKLAPMKSPIEGLYWAGDESEPAGIGLPARSVGGIKIAEDIVKAKIYIPPKE